MQRRQDLAQYCARNAVAQGLDLLSLAVTLTHCMSQSLGVGYVVDSLAAQQHPSCCQRSSKVSALASRYSLIMHQDGAKASENISSAHTGYSMLTTAPDIDIGAYRSLSR
jgi:hypothetical protein